MRGGDALKAVGLAALILALNMAILVAIGSIYLAASPYPAWATQEQPTIILISRWSAPIGGGVLFFLAMRWLARRRLDRRPLRFAAITWVAYVIIDVGVGTAMMDLRSNFSPEMALSMTLALAGALAGAAVARPRPVVA